jgi:protein SCO1/2
MFPPQRVIMPTRRNRLRNISPAVAALGILAGALGFASCSSSTPAATITQVGGPQETNSNYPGALVFPKAYKKPNVTLTDTANQPFNVATDTPAKVTLVYFGYTHCPDLCPLNMYLAASSIEAIPAAVRHDVQVVFVTTDPTRDTPGVIRTWLNHFSSTFTGLTGSVPQIQQAEKSTGIPLSFAEKVTEPGASYGVVHAGYILVYTRGVAHLEFPAEIRRSQETQDLVSLVQHGWQSQ